MTDDELNDVLAQLDDEDIEALAEMIEDSPELLRQALTEYGYREESADAGEDDKFLVNREDDALTDAQRELGRHLDGRLQTPHPVDEIVEMIGSEDSAFRQQYSSAQYRSWVSEQLNALVEAGELGRLKEGRKVHYTESPELAIRHWARLNQRFVEDLSVADSVEIKNDTGMPARAVKEAIRSLTDD